MAKKFDMGEFAKTLAQPVSDPDTGREQIEYIDVDLLDSDPGNFYALSNLDELADNIAVVGLQQPVRVRDGEDGHVVIVSGHRRTAAIRKLVADGRTDLREVPCIREKAEGSEALRELRLIYANSSTRELTSAEISRQAEKVQELLYRLKEEGYDFPGRMRDHVAEACRISRTKLARLEAIRHNLAPDIRKAYWDGGEDDGRLNESTAYELAKLPEDVQRQIVDAYRAPSNNSDPGLRWLYSYVVERIGKVLDGMNSKQLTCEDGGACSHRERMQANVIRTKVRGSAWTCCGCEKGVCCAACSDLQGCKAVCPTILPQQRKLKAAAKAEKERTEAEITEKQRPVVERIDAIWRRFGQLRQAAGLTPGEYLKAIGCEYFGLDRHMEGFENGRETVTPETNLPFGYSCRLRDINRWRAAADALGCSVDYLMMRTDVPDTAAASAPLFVDGTQAPTRSGPYYCHFDCDETDVYDVFWWDNVLHEWQFGRKGNGIKVEAVCLGWYPLPTVEDGGEYDQA